MSKAFRNSPSKKLCQGTGGSGPAGDGIGSRSGGSGTGGSGGWHEVGQPLLDSKGDPRTCPDKDCGPPRGNLLVKIIRGIKLITCNNNQKDDPTSCQFIANLFAKDRESEPTKSKIACLCCNASTEFKPSIGKPTGVTDEKGKPVYHNWHLFFEDCAGKRIQKGNKNLLVHVIKAKAPVVGLTCEGFNGTTYDSLKEGCTGEIEEGADILRSWAQKDPPQGFHIRCAKRSHEATIDEIVRDRRFRGASGLSAEDEAKAPSIEVTEDLDDI